MIISIYEISFKIGILAHRLRIDGWTEDANAIDRLEEENKNLKNFRDNYIIKKL